MSSGDSLRALGRKAWARIRKKVRAFMRKMERDWVGSGVIKKPRIIRLSHSDLPQPKFPPDPSMTIIDEIPSRLSRPRRVWR